MRKAGVTDYEAFAKDILAAIPDRSISFEVFADDFSEMERQARAHHDLGQACLGEDPDHQHQAGKRDPAGAQAVAGRDRAQRHRDVHARAGAGRGRCREGRRAVLRFGVRRPHRRYRRRSRADHGRIGEAAAKPRPTPN